MTETLIETILAPLLPLKNKEVLALHEPDLTGNELAYVTECVQTGWVSSVGKFVDQFEERLAAYVGAPKAVAVVNGTAGLHLALLLVGVKPRDEVLTPALTFVATSNAIAYTGAIPHFIDSSIEDLSVGASELNAYLESIVEIKNGYSYNRMSGRKISALIVMHALGHPADMVALKKVADKFSLKVVEDAAEALGSYIGTDHVGLMGDVGVFSFNGNKIITTGGGGAIVSNDIELMKRAKHLSTTAKASGDGYFYHDEVGFNYRLPNINAALGVAQLEKLPSFLENKKQLAAYYDAVYENSPLIRSIKAPRGTVSNNWLCAVKLQTDYSSLLQALIEKAHEQKIMLRPLWNLNNTLPMYRHCPSMLLSNAEAHVNTTICLPSSAGLSFDVC